MRLELKFVPQSLLQSERSARNFRFFEKLKRPFGRFFTVFLYPQSHPLLSG